MGVEHHNTAQNHGLNAPDDQHMQLGQLWVAVDVVVDYYHLGHSSSRVQHQETVVSQPGSQRVAFEHVVEVPIDVSDRPNDQHSGESQTTCLWLNKAPGHHVASQNLEEASDCVAFGDAEEDEEDVADLEELYPSEHLQEGTQLRLQVVREVEEQFVLDGQQ